jgi:ribulose 1,5-bisphosphate synthetase/thiazole synthase
MKSTSIWRDTAQASNYSCLQNDAAVDVAIIGGGITGITAAYLLGKAGIKSKSSLKEGLEEI